eukprot:8520328-Ditylum_brightwellii.AAC.1
MEQRKSDNNGKKATASSSKGNKQDEGMENGWKIVGKKKKGTTKSKKMEKSNLRKVEKREKV